MNLNYFHPKTRNVENKNNCPVNIRFVAKTSDIRNFYENIRSDVKTSEVSTLVGKDLSCRTLLHLSKQCSLGQKAHLSGNIRKSLIRDQ